MQKTPAPQTNYPRAQGRNQPSSLRRGYEYDAEDYDSDEDYIGGTPYVEMCQPPSGPSTNEGPSTQHHPVDVEKQAGMNVPAAAHRPPAPTSHANDLPRHRPSDSRSPVRISNAHELPDSRSRSQSGGEHNTDETAVAASNEMVTEGAPPHPLAKETAQPVSPTSHTSQPPPTTGGARSTEEGLPPPQFSRRPPTHPVLLPEFRYCYKCGLVKPMRAHHCRICGTVSRHFFRTACMREFLTSAYSVYSCTTIIVLVRDFLYSLLFSDDNQLFPAPER